MQEVVWIISEFASEELRHVLDMSHIGERSGIERNPTRV